MILNRNHLATHEIQNSNITPQVTPNPFPAAKCLAAMLVWVALIHATGLGGEFIFDDDTLLQQESLRDLFGFQWFRLSGRPVAASTFAFNFTFFGDSPRSFHVVSIAVHLATVASLFFLVRRTLLCYRPEMQSNKAGIAALSAACLWGVHPLSTSAVVYIVQRSEALASLFIILTLLFWARAFGASTQDDVEDGDRSTARERSSPTTWNRTGWAALAIIAAYLGYGSKEISAGLAFIVLLYDRIFIAKAWRPITQRWMWYGILLAPLIIGCWILLPGRVGGGNSTGTIGFNIRGITPWGYFTSQPFVFLQYLKLTIWPVAQSLDYGWLPSSNKMIQILGLSMWVGIFAGLVILWRRCKPVAFCFAAALIVLSPTSSIMPLQDIIFEHRFYLPLACLIAAVIGWLVIRFDSFGPPLVSPRLLILGMLIVSLSGLTVRRNLQWWSALEISQLDLRNNPQNPRALISIAGLMNQENDQPSTMLSMYSKAIEMSKKRGYFYAGTDYKWTREVADILFMNGQASRSRPVYEEALGMSYNELQRTEILFQLAMVASMEGRHDDAERLFQETLSGHPKIRETVEAVYAEHRRRVSIGKSQPEQASSDKGVR